MRPPKFKILFLLPGLLAWAPAAQADDRSLKLCGWISNPTPANWSLIDRSGEWIVSVQGGYQAQGNDLLPKFPDDKWVKTNGYYGYGCACLTATVDKKRGRVLSISAADALPLSTCRKDKNLPRPPA